VMELLVLSFAAGVLTVLAPCILPLLPIIVGGSLNGERNWRKPLVITASLAVSIMFFTLALKATSSLLSVPTFVWETISGIVIILLGITLLWPGLWERTGANLNIASNQLLGASGRKKGWLGDILTGAALGPVFNSCSPTYALIVAGVLPVSVGTGLGYLAAYVLGLSAVLLLVALIGQKLVAKLQWASNPKGWFKRTIGALFIIVGILIATGLQKQIETFLIDQGWYDPFSRFERSLMR
jgi:cytochrome c-type biogenesis protein